MLATWLARWLASPSPEGGREGGREVPVPAMGGRPLDVHGVSRAGKDWLCRCCITAAESFLLLGIAFPLGVRRMDEAAGDLKQALPNVCDNVQIHVEVHQKSSRSLIRTLLAATCVCCLLASCCAPTGVHSTLLCHLYTLP